MNPNIAIIIDYIKIEDNGNSGGSETWAIEMAKQFAKNNYNVFLFSLNQIWWDTYNGLQYVPIANLENMLTYIKFDYVFISRYIFSDTLNKFNDYPLNHNIYWVAHDTEIDIDNKPVSNNMFNENDILKKHLNKIICMSEFCKECIQNVCNLSDEYFEIIGNGLNISLFKNENNIYKDNNLFWSSRWERGLELVVNNVLPILQRDYPNMKVYVAQYENNFPDHLKENSNIVFLGQLTKQELYKEMQKHKVMFYPNFYPETFCITIIEAIMNDEEVICPFVYGPATTFKNYRSAFTNYNIYYETEEQYNEIANDIKYRIESYYSKDRMIIRNLLKEHILNEYSWESIFNKYKERILK